MEINNEKWNIVMIAMYFLFRTIPVLISGFTIYLGYKLFILGVNGQASLVINAKDISGQLINAAPGLFFAVGGIVALIVSIVKGVQIRVGNDGMIAFSRKLGN